MKPPQPIPEPSPVTTLRRYGLNATADEVREVYDTLMLVLPVLVQAYEEHGTTCPDNPQNEALTKVSLILSRISPVQKKI